MDSRIHDSGTTNCGGSSSSNDFFLAVHAGAGFHSRAREQEYRRAVSRACLAGSRVLEAGLGARAAVVAAVKSLEEDPITNAGIGSNLNTDGFVENDASVIDGTQTCGAVGAVPGVGSAIEVADAVAGQSKVPMPLGRVRPLMLAGDRARQWALERGLSAASSSDEAHKWSVTDEATSQWQKYTNMIADADALIRGDGEGTSAAEPPMMSAAACPQVRNHDPTCGSDVYDTVGAVCVDSMGMTAAAVSSGGIAMKTPGRVGEAGIIGSGCWAEVQLPLDARLEDDASSSCSSSGDDDAHAPSGGGNCRETPSTGFACSVSGVGERIMLSSTARRCSERAKRHRRRSVSEHCTSVIQDLGKMQMPNTAGIIAVQMSACDGGRARASDDNRSSGSDSDLDENQCRTRPPLISVEFAAVHSASSMAIGYLSGGQASNKPVTKMLRQQGAKKGKCGTKSRKRCRNDTAVSVFGTSVSW